MARRMSAFVGKQTSLIRSPMSANDPKRTFALATIEGSAASAYAEA